MKKIILALCLFTCYKTTEAQYKLPSEEEATLLKEKTLLVVLPEDDGSDAYITASNEWLKEIISATWKYTSKIEFVTATQGETRMANASSPYAILDQGLTSRSQRISANMIIKHEVWEYRIKLQNEKGKWKEAFSIPMLSRNLGYTDLQYIITQCQLYFESVSKGLKKKDIVNFDKNLQVLKSKTLYLTEDQLKRDKDKISEAYEGKVEFVSGEELEKKILARDPNCLFISYVYSDQKTSPVFIIVDAEFLYVRGISGPGGITITAYSQPPPNSGPGYKDVNSVSFRSKIGIGKSELNTFFNKTAQTVNNGL